MTKEEVKKSKLYQEQIKACEEKNRETPGTLINVVKYHGYIVYECLECFKQNIDESGFRAYPLLEVNCEADDHLECSGCKTEHCVSGISEDGKLIIKLLNP